ncbi:hypothetical protein [Haloechinothrix sp. LS1_15]|uniref:hypothetical protein n=1 Tax=Haloechinothrix sp. LS1_15 TaxID=2652248 RepID=UPI00294724B1|nr:hypothetical protein [Haloechinothrix sp. LS1_15]MDV6011176.1 hypothetical protein [Haloechinothrix sp. LS1_15]
MTVDADTFLCGPLACGVLLAARDAGYTAADVVEPAVSFSLVVAARAAIDPWDGDFESAVAEVLAQRASLRSFAREVLAQPGVSWWLSPVARGSQVHGHGATTGPTTTLGSSVYAQSPRHATVTSTRVGGDTCHDAITAHHLGDGEPDPSPTRTLLHADHGARVFEINSAESWHQLAHRYPLADATPQRERGGLAPDWNAVARDWDGVHLSLFGYLAATHVPLGNGDDTTVLWTWDGEQTCWLRDVLTPADTVPAASDADRMPPARLRLRSLDHARDETVHSRRLRRSDR